jgi:hypothetical protein
MTNLFGIDVETKHKATVIRRLRALKSTIQVEDGGVYHEDKNYSQIHLKTTFDLDVLENWLWATKGIETIGTFNMGEHEWQ